MDIRESRSFDVRKTAFALTTKAEVCLYQVSWTTVHMFREIRPDAPTLVGSRYWYSSAVANTVPEPVSTPCPPVTRTSPLVSSVAL